MTKLKLRKECRRTGHFREDLSAANRHMFEGSSTKYRYTVKATYMGMYAVKSPASFR